MSEHFDCTAVRGLIETVEACAAAKAFLRCNRIERLQADFLGAPACAMDRFAWRMAKSRIPARERALLLADVRREAPLAWSDAMGAVGDALARWKHRRPGNRSLLVLGGIPRTGKTLAACYALSRLGGLYVTAPDLVALEYDQKAGRSLPSPYVRPARKATCLVIDQLGMESCGNTDYALSLLQNVIDVRYAELLPTILVGNILRETFDGRYKAPIAGRVRSDGLFVRVSNQPFAGRS